MIAGLRALAPLWPGSRTTVRPAPLSAGAGAGAGTGAGAGAGAAVVVVVGVAGGSGGSGTCTGDGVGPGTGVDGNGSGSAGALVNGGATTSARGVVAEGADGVRTVGSAVDVPGPLPQAPTRVRTTAVPTAADHERRRRALLRKPTRSACHPPLRSVPCDMHPADTPGR